MNNVRRTVDVDGQPSWIRSAKRARKRRQGPGAGWIDNFRLRESITRRSNCTDELRASTLYFSPSQRVKPSLLWLSHYRKTRMAKGFFRLLNNKGKRSCAAAGGVED